MKKLSLFLLSVSALALVAALIAPGFVGPRVEETWKQQLGQIQGSRILDYQRGWFGSEAATELQSSEGNTELRSDIQHGPLLFTASGPRLGAIYSETRLTVGQLAPSLRAQLEKFYGRLDHSPLVLETLVGADNRVLNTLRLEPFTRSDIGGELKFDGAELLFETDYRGTAVDGTVEVGTARLSKGGVEKFHSEPVQGRFHYAVAERRGEANLTLPMLRGESESGPLELHDASLQLDLEQLASGQLKLVSDLILPQIQSATPISSVKQHLTLPQISAADLAHYLGALMLPAAGRDWQQVMQRPLQLQQQLAIESANGPVMMDADVDWRGLPVSARPVKLAPGQWLEPMVGTATFSAAEQALMQSPLVGQAMMLRQYGLLLENDGELQMHLEVNRGDLQVNGQQLPPDLFMLALTGQF